MKSIMTAIILLGSLFSQMAVAQSQITSGVNFFRRSNSWVPVDVDLAEASIYNPHSFKTGSGADDDDYVYSDRFHVSFDQVKNGGLAYNIQLSFLYRGRTQLTFFGEINLTNCVSENGKNIFGQFKSLEEVLSYSHETANATQFSSCVFSAPVLSSTMLTPNGSQPRITMQDFKMYIFAGHVQITGVIRGTYNGAGNFASPFLYYSNGSTTNADKLAAARAKVLSVLQKALETLQGEAGNQQLPKTVAYIMENRKVFQSALGSLENLSLRSYELIEFAVSVKNAFHILDQAVGLASNRQIQMNQLIEISN